MNTLLTQLLPIISAVIGSGAFLAVFTDRRKRAAEASKTDAEGQVALSEQTMQWSQAFSAETEKARARADKAEKVAQEANRRADQCSRDRDKDRERIDDLERQLSGLADLLTQIEKCDDENLRELARSLRR